MPGSSSRAWLVGGLLSLAGALANAELGAMYPHAGGDYVYLREAFHPAAGFLIGWLSFFVIYAGTVATLAAGFAAALAPAASRSASAAQIALAIGARARDLGDQLRRRAARRARQQLDQRSSSSRRWCLRGRGPRDRRRRRRAPAPRSPGSGAIALVGLRPRALAGALHLPRLERLGLRRERDPRSGAQRAALAVPRARPLHRDLPRGERRLSLRAAGRRARGRAERRRGGGARALRLRWRHAGRAAGADLDPRHAERDDPGGPRIAYAMALDGLFFGGVDRVHADLPHARIGDRRAGRGVAAAPRAARAFRACSTTRPSRSCSRRWPIRLSLYALRRAPPDRRVPTAPGATRWVPALYLVANAAIAATCWGTPLRVRDRPRGAAPGCRSTGGSRAKRAATAERSTRGGPRASARRCGGA